jgi:trigger factor
MQVTELSAEGLKREYRITVPADEIATRVNGRLQRLQRTVRMPGFRPGKAPLPLLRKQYGRSIMGEVLEEAVEEGTRQAVEGGQLRPAMRPKVDVTSFDEGKDLEFKVDLELLPEVPEVELESLELTRLTTEVDDEKVERALENLARARQRYEAAADAERAAREGDQVVIDFEGRIGGETFEGGSGKGFSLVLGSKSMVPGFEDQLVGAKPGERRQVAITFPAEYPAPDVAGKEAVFDVTVELVKEPVTVAIDDAWAKELGEEDLAAVKARLRERLGQEYGNLGRARMKRQLLDRLAERYAAVPVPEGMVQMEFDAIWKQLQDEMRRTGEGPETVGKSEEELKEEYRKIAERRVRLGLILSDIGNRNGVRVEGEELQQAVLREAMRFPGQERKVFEFFRSNAGALEQLRAPLFEDKVCDFVFGKAKVEERPVPLEELLRDPEDDDGAAGAEAPAPAAAAAAAADRPAEGKAEP